MSVIVTIGVTLLLAFIGSEVARHFRFPRTVGQLVAGILFSIPFIRSWLFTPDTVVVVQALSQLSIIFLLLLAGLEVNVRKMTSNRKEIVAIGLLASVIPFLFGFALGWLLQLGLIASFILGASFSVTAEETVTIFLVDMNKVTSRLGTVMLGAGIVDDIFEILFLAIVVVLAHQSQTVGAGLLPLVIKIALFLLVTLLAYRFLPRFIRYVERERGDVPLFSLTVLVGLLLAILTELIGLGAILGAFIAGLIIRRSLSAAEDRRHELNILQTFLFGFIITFFFVYIGYNFDFTTFWKAPLLILLVIFVAIAGKLIGTFVAKPFTDLSWTQLHLVGWSMNSRGVMELVIAQIAYSYHFISPQLYSAIVFMAVVTTIIFPLILRWIIRKNPAILEAG